MAGDKTFGLNNRGDVFLLENASVDFDGDDLIIDGNERTLGFDNNEKTGAWSCYRRIQEKL